MRKKILKGDLSIPCCVITATNPGTKSGVKTSHGTSAFLLRNKERELLLPPRRKKPSFPSPHTTLRILSGPSSHGFLFMFCRGGETNLFQNKKGKEERSKKYNIHPPSFPNSAE